MDYTILDCFYKIGYYLVEKEVKLMNFIKLILIVLGLILAFMLVSSVIGLVYSALWYLLIIGIIGGSGYVGYKLLTKERGAAKLEDKTPIAIADTQNADRVLEEYRRKHLNE